MQKKLIALAIAGVMAAPMASADVEIYGKVRLSVGLVSDDNPGATSEDSKLSVTSHASRLGFKGSDDLGNGLTALWQVETQIDMDDNSNTDPFEGMRNTYVGLAGDFGQVRLGRHDTPYKMATKDIMADTYGDYNAVVSKSHDYRSDNLIAYISPDMSGFSFAAAYIVDAEDGGMSGGSDNLPDNTQDDDNDGISLMAKYKTGAFGVSLGVQSVSNAGGANTDDAEATKLGLTYDLGATDLMLVYENEEMGSTLDRDNIYFGLTHGMGDGTIKFGLGQKGESASGASDGGDFLALGWFNKMSDSTEWYAVYSQMANDTNGTHGVEGVKSGFADQTTSALAVGINHKFSSM